MQLACHLLLELTNTAMISNLRSVLSAQLNTLLGNVHLKQHYTLLKTLQRSLKYCKPYLLNL